MAKQRWTFRALEIFMVVGILAPASWVSIPQAHASVASATESCPSTDFTVDDVKETVPFWALGEGDSGAGFRGYAGMHVTVPGPGTVDVFPDDGTYTSQGSRELTEAGTYGIDIHADSWADDFRALYESQQSKTINYTVTFTPTNQGGECTQPDGSVVYAGDVHGTQTASINWVPHSPIVNPSGPSVMTTGCYTVEITCYERAVTLNLTRKTMSGTITEIGGGTHCWGTGKDVAYVFLWKLSKGKWVRLAYPKATYGKYSASLTSSSWLSSEMKKGGTFQAAINPGANRGSDYTCGAELSNVVKLKPL